MGITVNSFFWVMQDLCHQQWERERTPCRLYEGPHILGGTLVGVLYEEEGWLRAELLMRRRTKKCR